MLQAVQIKGGSAVSDLVSRCLKLASPSSTRRFVRNHLMEFNIGINKPNFSLIEKLYSKLTKASDTMIESSPPLCIGCTLGQDESPCIKNISLKVADCVIIEENSVS
jgi:hypothetical protein